MVSPSWWGASDASVTSALQNDSPREAINFRSVGISARTTSTSPGRTVFPAIGSRNVPSPRTRETTSASSSVPSIVSLTVRPTKEDVSSTTTSARYGSRSYPSRTVSTGRTRSGISRCPTVMRVHRSHDEDDDTEFRELEHRVGVE